MNEDYINKVEKRLCEFLDRTHCILTSRGTVAIYAILKSMEKLKGRGKVIIPAVIAPSVPSVVLYSGYEPVFCDISRYDYNMDIDSLKKVVENYDDVKGLIAVHLYGQPLDMDEILKIAEEYDLFVIEDAAQTLGGEYKNRKLGSFGDASILSFGHTKIIDKAQAGAVLTDRDDVYHLVKKELSKIPPYQKEIENRKALYSKVYYTLQPLLLDYKLDELFIPLPYMFKDIYLYNRKKSEMSTEANKINSELDKLDYYVKRRRENAKEYRKSLLHPDIIHPNYKHEGGVPWRYSFLLRNNQREVTEVVRARDIDISNWYPPLHRWFIAGKKQDQNLFKNSIYVGDHIVNLWTEPSTTKEDIKRTSEIFLDVLDKNKEGD